MIQKLLILIFKKCIYEQQSVMLLFFSHENNQYPRAVPAPIAMQSQ